MNLIKDLWFPLIITISMVIISDTALAKPYDKLKNSSYAYNAEDVFVGKALKDFADSFGIKLKINAKLVGNIDSRIRTNSAESFLERLALQYNFNWFLFSNTIYIVEANDNDVYRLEVSESSIYDLKSALEDIGLFSQRFGWGELPDEGVILVSGPKEYINLIKKYSRPSQKTIRKQRKDNINFEVMVFPLKFASVIDREVRYREDKLVIPGVATLIKQLLYRDTDSSSNEIENIYQINRNKAISQTERLTGTETPTGSMRPSSNTRQSNNVSADVRNNSVLIYDDKSKRRMYEKLIDKMDKISQMVEIDAIILDIERTELSRIGINWAYTNNGTTIGSFQPPGSLVQTATLFIRNPVKFNADLMLLESEGKATLLANPSILTLENQPAVIDSSQTSYIQTTGERVVDVKEITAGVGFQVVPRILRSNGNTTIQLDVDIEDGKIVNMAESATPIVNRSSISTQALVSSGESLVFGGFHVSEDSSSTSQIPILGDIPILGSLFSIENTSSKKRVRLFILTPRILDSSLTQDLRDYVDKDDREVVSNAISDVKRKRFGTRDLLKVDIGNAIKSLTNGYIPDGFEIGKVPIPICRRDVIIAKFPIEDRYISDDLGIAAGTIYNPSSTKQRYDESNCAENGVLAVSVWPSTVLAPGEKAEIYVVKKMKVDKIK